MTEMTDTPPFFGDRHLARILSLRGLFGQAFATVSALAFGAWLWASPALAQYADPADMADRLARLENQVMALQDQLARGGGGGQSASGGAVAPTQAADFEIRLSQLERTVQQMVGKYEEAGYEVTQLRERLDKMSTDFDFRLSQMDSKGGSAAASARPPESQSPTAPPAKSAPASASVTAPAGKPPAKSSEAPLPSSGASAAGSGLGLGGVSANVQEQYDEAYGLLHKAEYDQAEKALTAFVAQHHDSPLAANAQYWLGETYYARGKFTEAAVAFAEGFQKFPKSAKAPDDLLKLGMALASLNQKNDACKTLDQLGTQFPTAAASLKRRAEQERKRLACP